MNFSPQKLIITDCARSGTALYHSLMGYFRDVKVNRYAETLPARFDRRDLFGVHKRYIVIKRPQFHPEDERTFSLDDLLQANYLVINLIRDGRDVLVARHQPERSRRLEKIGAPGATAPAHGFARNGSEPPAFGPGVFLTRVRENFFPRLKGAPIAPSAFRKNAIPEKPGRKCCFF